MISLGIISLLSPKKRKEEKRIIQKVKEKGVDSLTKEEKKIYQDLIGRMIIA